MTHKGDLDSAVSGGKDRLREGNLASTESGGVPETKAVGTHTPGPWTARLNSWVRWEILYGGGQLAVIAKPDDPASPPPVSETEANARLIAAAPDLLAALKAACGYFRNVLIDLDTGTPKATTRQTVDGGLKMIEAALAKARAHSPRPTVPPQADAQDK